MNDDPFDLRRFVEAQGGVYETALAELVAGRKRSHWMWFIFPQFAGLGFSAMSQRYAIGSLAEARAYLDHPVLGARLRQTVRAVLQHRDRSAHEIFGSPDDFKFRSCLTLFDQVAPGYVFAEGLVVFFTGKPDEKTLQLLATRGEA
ncbi:DUF1810 domain-containing protein [Pseudaminobacter sp. 19-2017]|uniref:DUF1810 domain-containing protein n=1 Tax=Pseudaminobacter soli (ex Zhang et al. 2022) TaxID=2831468 RepID=A0A942I9N8_9HYPH|nr:DUF1810 domain-containing protein [Pseudaminobacter soli]MBS3649581.1 DUF1810 domain-containing protein [Pseudaminobacter soli]